MGWLNNYLVDARKRYKIAREKPQFWCFEKQGFGYIQIPKVATRSIRKALLTVGGEVDNGRPFADFEQQYSAHVDHAVIRQQVDCGVFVFAFVRDPLARLHSAWVNKIVDGAKYGRRNIFRCHGMPYGMSFRDFVVRVSELRDSQVDRHIRSQAWFLCDAQGLLPGFVGHLESFGSDWEDLRKMQPALGAVGHINKAAHNMDYLAAYDSETMALAVNRYRQDFELFGYPIPNYN